MKKNAGFISLNDYFRKQSNHGKGFPEDPKKWDKRINALIKDMENFSTTGQKMKLNGYYSKVHESLVKSIKKLNAEPIIVFQPPNGRYLRNDILSYRELLPKSQVLDYNYYNFPDFKNQNLWFDRGHLNKAGAIIFSEYIYGNLCEINV